MKVKAIEDVIVDYAKNCTEGKIYECYGISDDGLRYGIIDDDIEGIYLSKNHFEIVEENKEDNKIKDKIKTIEILNNFETFDNTVNELLNDGWKILSTNCGSSGFENWIDTCYQAILIKRGE